MRTRNKVFIGSGIAVLLMLLAGYGWVSAYGPWCDFGGRFPARFHERGMDSGFRHKEISEFILWRMDKKARELNLTEAQKAKYEVLKNNITAHLSEGFGERQAFKARVQTELNKETPDLSGLIQSVKLRINEFSGVLDKNLDLLADFYDSLDSVQKQKINREIKERMAYHHS
jgi:hypothetical protein